MRKSLLCYPVLLLMLFVSNGLVGQNKQSKKPQTEASVKVKTNTAKKENAISKDEKKKRDVFQESSAPKTAYPNDYGVPITSETTESSKSQKSNPKK